MFDMDQYNVTMDDIPKKWRDLDGQEVVITGEIIKDDFWTPRYDGNDQLTSFQLVYSLPHSGRVRPAQQFVDCNVVKGVKVEYSDDIVQVFGTIHIRIDKNTRTGVIKSIYHVDVVDVKPIN